MEGLGFELCFVWLFVFWVFVFETRKRKCDLKEVQ